MVETASISPLVTRPSLPEPLTLAESMPVSAARRRTAGEMAVEAPSFAATGAEVTGGAAGAEAPAVAESSMVATTAPIFTSVPAATLKVILPAASATPSEVILSVSNSKSG